MSNLTIRVLVAVVGIPLICLLVMAGGFWFFGFLLLVALLGLREFYRLAEAKGAHPQVVTGTLLGVLVMSVFLLNRIRDSLLPALQSRGIELPFPSATQWLLIILLIGVPLLFLVELFRNRGSALINIAMTLSGVLYVAFFLGALSGIRELFAPDDFPVARYFSFTGIAVPDEALRTMDRWGGFMVLAIFVSIWICDSAAYFVGRAFGRHKLFERVSPKKTWEGGIAGFIGAIGAFLLAQALALPFLSSREAVICGCVVGLFGQLGDLAESLLKRDAGVKDSSALIPGHGGVLDRFDSVLFVSPLLFVYLDFVVFMR